jgi:pyruvate/2-oxoglutarate dehydrogenase complex dihydrolipoamide dehydrogenase (E3) component
MHSPGKVLPEDQHNRVLLRNVHPVDWKNPEPAQQYNLVVLGAGTAGLVSAAAAAGLGAKVALIEKNLMGGDCLNVGCVPSKALIRSSRVRAGFQQASEFGIETSAESRVNFPEVMERLRRLRAGISHHDSVQRFSSLGIDLFLGEGRFFNRKVIEVDGKLLRFKKAVIATGARPAVPSIPGLEGVGYLTNETVFSLTEQPSSLLVIGGGPIGCELAQAFCRLGSKVTLVEAGAQFLAREDPDAAAVLEHSMRSDGVDLRLAARVVRFESEKGKRVAYIEREGREEKLETEEILLGVGRIPNVEGLQLERAGVEFDQKRGVQVDDRLRTTNSRIFAAGDVSLDYKFTHTADAAARIVIQNALFLGRKKVSSLTVPWCTYTSPEIAHVGLYEGDAQKQGVETTTFKILFSEVDRAILDGKEEGFVKIHVRKGGDEILGATIVADHAGDMISEITLAMVAGVGLGKIANVIHPYPTQAEAIRKAADAYNRTRLTPFIKTLFEKWLSWQR